MTIETIERLLDAEPPPHNQREKRLIAALRAALDGLLAANAYSPIYANGVHEEVAKAIDEIERELQG